MSNFRLLETGDARLLETTDNRLLEIFEDNIDLSDTITISENISIEVFKEPVKIELEDDLFWGVKLIG